MSGSIYQRSSDGRWVAALKFDGKKATRYATTRRQAQHPGVCGIGPCGSTPGPRRQEPNHPAGNPRRSQRPGVIVGHRNPRGDGERGCHVLGSGGFGDRGIAPARATCIERGSVHTGPFSLPEGGSDGCCRKQVPGSVRRLHRPGVDLGKPVPGRGRRGPGPGHRPV
jgi:hypothetical protein